MFESPTHKFDFNVTDLISSENCIKLLLKLLSFTENASKECVIFFLSLIKACLAPKRILNKPLSQINKGE